MQDAIMLDNSSSVFQTRLALPFDAIVDIFHTFVFCTLDSIIYFSGYFTVSFRPVSPRD